MKSSMMVVISFLALLALAPSASALRVRVPHGSRPNPLLSRTRLVSSAPEVSSNALQAVAVPNVDVPVTVVPEEEKKTSLLRKVFSPATIRWTSVAAGCTATWVLNNMFGLGPVVGCGAVLVFNALFLPQHLIIPATTGSFAGMASELVIPTLAASVACGYLCAYMLDLYNDQKWFNGCGGRLGMIAQSACTVHFIAQKVLPGFLGLGVAATAASMGEVDAAVETATNNAALVNVNAYAMEKAKAFSLLKTWVLFTIAGGFFMRLWGFLFRPVAGRLGHIAMCMGMTGVTFGTLFPPIAAAAAIGGSFCATVSKDVIPTLRGLAIVLAFTGLWQFLFTGVLYGGWAGKLGTSALVACLIYRKVKNKHNARKEQKASIM